MDAQWAPSQSIKMKTLIAIISLLIIFERVALGQTITEKIPLGELNQSRHSRLKNAKQIFGKARKSLLMKSTAPSSGFIRFDEIIMRRKMFAVNEVKQNHRRNNLSVLSSIMTICRDDAYLFPTWAFPHRQVSINHWLNGYYGCPIHMLITQFIRNEIKANFLHENQNWKCQWTRHRWSTTY